MGGTIAAAFSTSAPVTNTFCLAAHMELESVCSYKITIVRDAYGVVGVWEASQLWLDMERR